MAEQTSDAAPAPATDVSNTPSRVDGAKVERRLWRRIKLWAKRTFAIATALSTSALAIWIAVLLTMAIPRPHSLDLAVITVPDSLAKSGFTDKVVTQRLADAIVEYREAIRLDPKYAQPHNDLGHVWVVLGKMDDAVIEYRDAIQLDPRSVLAHASLGDVLTMQSKYDDAVPEYRKALQLEPDEPALHYAVGSALLHKAQSETSLTSRTSSLDDACAEFMQGAQLTHAVQFSTAMYRIDRLLPKGQRCPPDSLPKKADLLGAAQSAR